MSKVEIYTITYDFNRWWYTSGDEDVPAVGFTYRAVPISRSEVEINSDESTGSFSATFPLDSEFLELFRVSPPSGLVTLLCERFDPNNPSDREIIFKGRIVNVTRNETQAELACESSSQAINRMGLRRRYQYGCPHMLYGGECRVDREQFVTIGPGSNITASSVDMIAVAGKPDNYFAGGYIEYTHSSLGTTERIAVSASSGPTLSLFSFPIGLVSGDEVRAYAGCNRTIATCNEKFNNSENYGGMPFIPSKNPFGSDPLF